MDAMITLDRTPVLSNAQKPSSSDLQSFDIFPAHNYRVRVNIYPTDEICIRFVPYVKDSGDNAQDIENKLLALDNRKAKDKERKLSFMSKEDWDNAKKPFKKPVKKLTRYMSEKDWLIVKSELGLTSKSSLPGWGNLPKKRKFKRETARNISRRVASVQRKFGRKRTKFGTITLPGSTDMAKRTIAEYTSYINNRINRFISNIIGRDARYRIQVWEFQKRGALHSHFVLASKDDTGLQVLKEKFPMFCYRMFLDISRMSGVDMFARKNGGTWKDRPDVLRCDIQDIKSNAAAYISKYMSKNVKMDAKQGDSIDKRGSGGKLYYPTKWATWGRGATEALHERTIKMRERRISGASCDKLATKCMEITQKYGVEKYTKPLLYLDSIGYGVNMRMLIKTDNMPDVIDELQKISINIVTSTNNDIKPRKVTKEEILGYEYAKACYEPMFKWNRDGQRLTLEEMQQEVWYAEGLQMLKEEAIRKKYGDSDPRRYLKIYRRNHHPIPTDSTSEQWAKYWEARN